MVGGASTRRVHRAHVVQLERRRGDDGGEVSAFEPILDLGAPLARHRAVVRQRHLGRRELVEREGEALGEAPAVDEGSWSVSAHEAEAPVQLGPDARGSPGASSSAPPSGDAPVGVSAPPPGSAMLLTEPASTMVTGRGWSPSKPPRRRATSSSGLCVAERPMRWSAGAFGSRARRSASSRSSERKRCAPRLVDTSWWISSTMTVSTPARPSRACEGSMR